MKHRQCYLFVAAAICSAGLTVAGFAGDGIPAQAAPAPTTVTLQLKWVTQAQFAGYYCAQAKGYYRDQGLDVTLKPGGPQITPAEEVAAGRAEFGVSWMSSLLTMRERGVDLVNIAQVMRRSGTTEITWKESGIASIPQLRGKRIAVWLGGNEDELFAALIKQGIDPRDPRAVTIVPQGLDMGLFLQRQVDAAAAMTYNELALDEFVTIAAYFSPYDTPRGATGDLARQFRAAFENRWGEPPAATAANHYDALFILKRAIEDAGSLEKARVREALARLDMPALTVPVLGGGSASTSTMRYGTTCS